MRMHSRRAPNRLYWTLAALAMAVMASPRQASLADETDLAVLDGQVNDAPAAGMMPRFLLDRVNEQLTEHRQQMLDRTAPEDIRTWQQAMRQWFVGAVGGLPARDTPLNAQVTGTVERDGYRVEKVLLQSQPGLHVTAALFLPDPKRHEPPYPAVLVACGHSANGKALEVYQRGAALMALHGLAAFMFDPIDQGERHQLRDEQGKPRVWGTQAHNALGVGAMLLGNNTSQYMIHDAIRCLDYLETRPDIDAARLGMAGNSGGGTQTSLVMGIEDRLKAAAPSCYITDFEHWLALLEERGDVPGDAEQNVAGQIGAGLDHWGFLLMRAPMPVLVCAAQKDFFPIAGTRQSVALARTIFERLDAADRIDLVETNAPHGWQQPLREATVAWMLRWLTGQEREVREPEGLQVLSEDEIRVTPTGQVLDLDGARSVYDVNNDLMERLRRQRQTAWHERGAEEMLGEVRRVTGIRKLEELRAPDPKHLATIAREGYRIDKLAIEPEPGIVLPALAFIPDNEPKDVVLWLDEQGKSSETSLAEIEKLAAGGRAVLAVDLRGLGETQSAQNHWYGPRNGHDGANVAVAYMLGRSYVAMRAEDVLTAAQVARTLARDDAALHLVARGARVAVPALHAAALERALFATVDVAGGPESFEQIVSNPLESDQLVHTVHAALTVYDLPDLRALLADDNAFSYEYEKVFDYYIIQAWRGLDEPVPAYTSEMVKRHTELVGKLPWVRPTASADEHMVLGRTPGRPKTPDWPDDLEIPSLPMYGYQITDPDVDGPKVKMVLAAQNHSTEFTGSWVLEGAVNFVAGSDPRAVFLRRKAIFYVYPDINPEGRYQAVHRIDLKAAPDPNAETNMRKRGNPELYAAGEQDHNRVWTTKGKFSTVDTMTAAMKKDTGGHADYLWDMHGPQEPANWRSPLMEARINDYAIALMRREPDVLRCGPPDAFKRNVGSGPPGKLSLWAASEEGLSVTYPYVYEPGGWTRERLLDAGRNLALALYDVLAAE
ncbi:MAG: acetylxylan esterase [Thermoguttaceae bacterium]|nr:acetylxylan esterase [Thermoguttaceae bacterium]